MATVRNGGDSVRHHINDQDPGLAPAVCFSRHRCSASLTISIMLSTTRRAASLAKRAVSRRYLASAAPQHASGQHGHLPSSQSAITNRLHFFNSVMGEGQQIPTYRVLEKDGKAVEGAELPEVSSSLERLSVGAHCSE